MGGNEKVLRSIYWAEDFMNDYKENIIQLEFVTYSDREVDVLRRAVTIVHLN